MLPFRFRGLFFSLRKTHFRRIEFEDWRCGTWFEYELTVKRGALVLQPFARVETRDRVSQGE